MLIVKVILRPGGVEALDEVLGEVEIEGVGARDPGEAMPQSCRGRCLVTGVDERFEVMAQPARGFWPLVASVLAAVNERVRFKS